MLRFMLAHMSYESPQWYQLSAAIEHPMFWTLKDLPLGPRDHALIHHKCWLEATRAPVAYANVS